MLAIDIPLEESYDELTSKFVLTKSFRVELEHSLVSASKWESFWEKSFLSTTEKTTEQTLSYVQMMILNEELPPRVLKKVFENHLSEINDYIGAKMTATTFSETSNASKSLETITTEIIYYWMISMNIPMECQHWHLNRLLTLIRVINTKNAPKKKMTASERRNLNKQRQAKYNTRG